MLCILTKIREIYDAGCKTFILRDEAEEVIRHFPINETAFWRVAVYSGACKTQNGPL